MTGIPEPKTNSNGIRNGKNSTAGAQVAIVTWDEEYLGKDKHGNLEPAVTSQKLLLSKWNKHSVGAWRFVLGGNKSN